MKTLFDYVHSVVDQPLVKGENDFNKVAGNMRLDRKTAPKALYTYFILKYGQNADWYTKTEEPSINTNEALRMVYEAMVTTWNNRMKKNRYKKGSQTFPRYHLIKIDDSFAKILKKPRKEFLRLVLQVNEKLFSDSNAKADEKMFKGVLKLMQEELFNEDFTDNRYPSGDYKSVEDLIKDYKKRLEQSSKKSIDSSGDDLSGDDEVEDRPGHESS